MARGRALVGILIASLLISLVPVPLPSIARHAVPPIVAAADDDLALVPPAGWSVSQSGANDGNDATSVDLNEGFCHPNCGVTLTFTQTSGTFPAIGSFRILWSQQSGFGSYISQIKLICAGTVLYQQDGNFHDSTFDTGRIAVTGTMSAQTTSFSCTWYMISAVSAGALHVFTISLWQAGPPSASGPGEQGTYPGIAVTPDPINIATGNFLNRATDLSMPGRVLGLEFTRSYNSADSTTGPLGPGWTHSYNWSLVDAGATVSVRRGDGRVLQYTRNADLSYSAPLGVFDVLVKNGDGTFTFTQTNQLVYSFSSAGALTQIGEPAGNHLAFSYTAGNLTTITDTVGRTVTLSYDGSNRVTQVQDPLGRKVTYAYDASGRLATVTDKIGNATGQNPSLHQWKYGYDGITSHLTTITDPDNRVRVTNTYDAQGRVYQQRDALSQLTALAYSTGQTVVTDPRTNATTYVFDSHFRELSESISVGGSTKTLAYAYDSAGNRASVTDRNGKTTDFSYDTRGNLLTKTDPQVGTNPRYVTSFQYDSKNNLTLITDARGMTTTMTYDPTTNVLLSVRRQIDATAYAITKYEYGDLANPGLPTKVIAPRGNTGPTPNYTYSTSLTYDSRGNLVTQIDADGAKTTFAYDDASRLLSSVDPDGNVTGGTPSQHTWSASLDENDRLTSASDPLGNALRYGYNGSGDRLTMTDRNGNVTTYTYDDNARLATVAQKPDPVGQPTLVYTTSVTRDANGNATHVTQANTVVTDYGFDALNRLMSTATHPDASTTLTTTYVLDGNGNPLTRTTGDGVIVTYGYDEMSRLTSVSAPNLATISYAYDEVSRRRQMVDGTGTTTYQYDGLSRITQVGAPAGTVTYVYDLDGNRTTLGYPGSQNVTYAYSPGGRLSTVMDWASRVSTYTYQPSGLVSTLGYPNGMTASYSYDRAQRLTQLVNSVGQTTITRDTYTVDAEGNRTALDEYVQGITPPVTTWSASVKVNDDATAEDQLSPSLVLDQSGRAFAVWADNRNRNASSIDIYFSQRDPATGAWSTNQRVNDSTTVRRQQQPSLALAPNGDLLAVWQDERNGNSCCDWDIYFSRRSASTGTWSANVRVNDDRGSKTQEMPRIAVRSTGEAIAVWRDSRGAKPQIYAARLPAGSNTWSANMLVTTASGGGAYSNENPDVAFRADGTAYVVWDDDHVGSRSRIFVSTLAPGSNTWTANVQLSGDVSEQFPNDRVPRIGADASGNVTVAWADGSTFSPSIRAKRLPAGSSTWLQSVVISEAGSSPDTAAWFPTVSLSAASDGHVAVAWEEDATTNFRIWGNEYDPATGNWGTPQMVSDDVGPSQHYPAIADNGSTVVVAWRDTRSDAGDIRVRLRTTVSGVDHFTYTYDGLNRLTAVGGLVSETFNFDAASNISSRTGPSATNSYDTSNRQTSDGARSFAWDGADRLITRGADTFSYDALSRLTSATVAGTTRAFTYNGDGILASRPEGALLWDSAVAPAPLLGCGTDKIVYGLGPLYVARTDGTTLTLARDGLGSVRAEVNDSGVLTKSFRYNAYGQLAAGPNGAPSLLGYAGELLDSGLIYLRARWYDPATGGLLSRDPEMGSPGTPVSLNPYAYAMRDPIARTDPTGREVEALKSGAEAFLDSAAGFLARGVGGPPQFTTSTTVWQTSPNVLMVETQRTVSYNLARDILESSGRVVVAAGAVSFVTDTIFYPNMSVETRATRAVVAAGVAVVAGAAAVGLLSFAGVALVGVSAVVVTSAVAGVIGYGIDKLIVEPLIYPKLGIGH